MSDEVAERMAAEDREQLALDRCAALEKRIAELEAQRTRFLSKQVVVKQEIMQE